MTSDGFFELESLPKKVAICGAGYIAVELAGILKVLGSDVTMFIRQDEFLRSFDDCIRETIMQEYESMGIKIVRNSNVVSAVNTITTIQSTATDNFRGYINLASTQTPSGTVNTNVSTTITSTGSNPLLDCTDTTINTPCNKDVHASLNPSSQQLSLFVQIDDKEIDTHNFTCFNTLLFAVGRDANTEALNLSSTGINLNQKEFIEFDEFQNTNVPGLLALGDVCGVEMLTPGKIRLSLSVMNHTLHAYPTYSFSN